jgi:hypothetical protein
MLAPQLVLVFGARKSLAHSTLLDVLRIDYPDAQFVGCSTAGEICETRVDHGSVVATAIHFDHSRIRTTCHDLKDAGDSRSVGESLASDLIGDDLVHVFVVAEGLKVNGSELVGGMRHGLPAHVSLTGGLAADGALFEQTMVCHGEEVKAGAVAAIGFYGDRLRIGYGSMGGWDPFGPDRFITRAEANVLYELDGRSALDLYKTYLGPHAAELPASGARFPLCFRSESGDSSIVRTISDVDESEGSLVFSGDIPQGGFARLMKANVDRLIDGAHGAASACLERLGDATPDLAILVSCFGRTLVLQQRTEEEVESVRDRLGVSTVFSGFYSYGEIAPSAASGRCELHNQTMTITTFAER